MKLAKLDLSKFNKFDQYYYLWKEIRELEQAFMAASFLDDQDEIIEATKALESEVWDVIQVCFGLLNMIGDVEQSNVAHEVKLKGYEEIRRIPKILGWIEFKNID